MKSNNFLFLFQKEKFYIAAGILLGLLVFALYFFAKYIPMYSSSSRVLVRNIPQGSVVTAYGDDQLVKSESGFSNPLFNYMEILHSQKMSDNVYRQLTEGENGKTLGQDLDKMHVTSLGDWYGAMGELLESKVEPSTDIIKISFKWNNPKTTDYVFNTILEQFRVTNLEIRKGSLVNRSNYLDEQLVSIGGRLDRIRQEIRNYRLRNRTIDLPIESAQLTGARVDLTKQVDVLKSQIHSDQVRMSNLAQQLGYPNGEVALKAAGVGGDPYLVKLNQELATAVQQEAKLSATQTEQHPERVQAMNEIDSLKKSIQARQSEILGSQELDKASYDIPSQNLATDLARTQAEYLAHKAQLGTLNQGVNHFISKENELPSKQLGLDELKKQEQSLALAYDNVSQKVMESKIKESQVDDNLIVIDPPSKPLPVYKELFVKLAALIILGGLGGFAIGWIQDYIEDRWKNPEEIEERTGESVLGVIPWERNIQADPFTSTMMASDSPSAVSYAALANTLMIKAYRENVKTMSFVATSPSRKGSPVSFNVASQLCRLGKSVLLINVNTEDSYHDVSSGSNWNLTQLVTEINTLLWRKNALTTESVLGLLPQSLLIRDSGLDSNPLHYLSAQGTTANLYDIIGSNGFQALLSALKERYEFILIDTPAKPFTYPEVQTLLQMADGVIVISGMEANRKRLFAIINKLKTAQVKILGIVARHKSHTLN